MLDRTSAVIGWNSWAFGRFDVIAARWGQRAARVLTRGVARSARHLEDFSQSSASR
jgi:hypothetical protein